MTIERNLSLAVQPPEQAGGARFAPVPDADPVFMAGESRPYFRLDLWRAVQLHKKVLLACILCGFLLFAAYIFWVWPIYTAESRVYVQPVSSTAMSHGGDQHWPYDSNTYDSFIQQQVQNADNPDVLAGALHKIDAGTWQKPGESEGSAAWRLGKAVEVKRLGTSYEISIDAHAGTPQLAAQIANGLAMALIAHSSQQQNAGDAQRLAILHDERNRIQQQMNADMVEQAMLNQQLGMASVGTSPPDLLDSAIVTARDELIKARTEHDQAAARLASLDASKSSSAAALQAQAEELTAMDPGLTAMKTSLYQRRAALISQMANLTKDNPAYIMDAEELNKINGSLDSMMSELRGKATNRIQQKLRADLERTAGVEARLNGQLSQLSASAAGSTPKLQRSNDLAADIVRLRTRYAAVDEGLHDLLLKDNVPGAMHLSVTATPPGSPAVSGVARKALPLAASGFFVGLFLVLILNNLDQKIYVAEDIRQLIGIAPAVSLPSLAEVSDEVFDEYVLRLSTMIERTLGQTESKQCVFTGVDFGVGVSTLAKRTRELIEGLGQNAVLVDSYAQSQAAGASAPTSSSTALEQRGKDRAVVADTAPLMASAETECMVRSAGCVVVVAQSGVTTRQQLMAMAQTLQRLNVPVVDFVLNGVRVSKADRAFRDTLAAVGKHVRVQGRRTSLHTRPVEEEETLPVAVAQPSIPTAAPAEASLQASVAEEPKTLGRTSAEPLLEQRSRVSARLPEFAAARPAPEPAPVRRSVEESAEPQPKKLVRAEQSNRSGAQGEGGDSRLNGLRAILFEQGLKNLNRSHESAAEPSLSPEPQAVRPAAPEVRIPVVEPRISAAEPRMQVAEVRTPAPPSRPAPPAEAPRKPAPREVLAKPEFLPPREFIPIQGDDAEDGERDDMHRDRHDPYDDVEILPSWRGQYRRKE